MPGSRHYDGWKGLPLQHVLGPGHLVEGLESYGESVDQILETRHKVSEKAKFVIWDGVFVAALGRSNPAEPIKDNELNKPGPFPNPFYLAYRQLGKKYSLLVASGIDCFVLRSLKKETMYSTYGLSIEKWSVSRFEVYLLHHDCRVL